VKGRERKTRRRIGSPVRDARGLQRCERLLVEKRQEVLATRAKAGALVPRAGGWQGDLIDQANANAEAELQICLRQADGRLLRAIEEALARIREGTYGVYEVCKQPLPRVRLEAVPWTRLCRECKERQSA
jgi:DnaK suppressor protein